MSCSGSLRSHCESIGGGGYYHSASVNEIIATPRSPLRRRPRAAPTRRCSSNIFQRGQKQQHIAAGAGLAHEADAPGLALSRAGAAAECDSGRLQAGLEGEVVFSMPRPVPLALPLPIWGGSINIGGAMRRSTSVTILLAACRWRASY